MMDSVDEVSDNIVLSLMYVTVTYIYDLIVCHDTVTKVYDHICVS